MCRCLCVGRRVEGCLKKAALRVDTNYSIGSFFPLYLPLEPLAQTTGKTATSVILDVRVYGPVIVCLLIIIASISLACACYRRIMSTEPGERNQRPHHRRIRWPVFWTNYNVSGKKMVVPLGLKLRKEVHAARINWFSHGRELGDSTIAVVRRSVFEFCDGLFYVTPAYITLT